MQITLQRSPEEIRFGLTPEECMVSRMLGVPPAAFSARKSRGYPIPGSDRVPAPVGPAAFTSRGPQTLTARWSDIEKRTGCAILGGFPIFPGEE